MIRMGRSSKLDEGGQDTSALNEQPSTTAFDYDDAAKRESNRAVSESESMARDIKEGRLSGFVGAGTVLTGETSFQAMLRVDGHLTGRVTSEEGTLIIGSTGKVDADIAVAAAIVNGTVNGDIMVTEKLELGRTARVVGNLQAPRVIVADGAILEGNCSMLHSKETLETRLEEQKRQFATTELAEEESAEAEFEADETDSELFESQSSESYLTEDDDESALEDEEEAADAATN